MSGSSIRLGSEFKLEPPRNGLLRREDFCEERIAALAAEAKTHGIDAFLSKEEREKSLSEFMHGIEPGRDLWVFGYGSLMWNPAVVVSETRPALIFGLHRWFCLSL